MTTSAEKIQFRNDQCSHNEDDCVFCDILLEPKSAFDVLVPLEDAAISVKPALGMLMPGYFLTVTHDHMTSFANMKRDALATIDVSLNKMEHELEPHFGRYFRLEHGSDSITSCGSGGCIDHAHQHLIPANEDVGEHIFNQLNWEKLDTFADIADFQGKPYMYLGRLGAHYAIAEPDLPGQWGRRQIGNVRGIEHWDWALYSGDAELALTLESLKKSSIFQDFTTNPLAVDHRLRHAPGQPNYIGKIVSQ